MPSWLLALATLAAAAEPTLPELLETVPPVYPEEALGQGAGATVLLELDLDASGRVADARVVESGGAAFDAAAVQAARSFRFTPARDERGDPVPATLRYRTVFAPELAPPVSVEGRVRVAGTRQPLAGADVVLVSGERRIVATTDAEGTFRVAGLPEGSWTVATEARGYRDEGATIGIVPGKVVTVVLHPIEDRPWELEAQGVSETLVVEGRRDAAEVTERTLSSEELRYLPGTAGDVVRAVQNLPGVARPPLGIGQLVIRGTAPEDSAYYLDGSQIPNVFHFAGLSTVINGEAVASLSYLPGNYGVRYGRTLGGVVDLSVVSDLPTRSRGYVSVDLFQTTAFAEQRFGRTALTVSGRRSYIDAVLNPVLAGMGSSTVRAPRYYDLQASLRGETARGGRIDGLFLLSDDRFRVVGDAEDADEVQIGLTTTFSKFRLRHVQPLGEGWSNEASLLAGPEQQGFELAPDGEAYERAFTVALREELLKSSERFGLRLGTDTQVGTFRFSYDVEGFGEPESADVVRVAPSAYVEPTVRVGQLELVPGLRADALVVDGAGVVPAVDPRLGTRWRLFATTAVKASFGGYSQFPTVRQLVEQPDLSAQRSWQSSVGLEQALGPDVDLELTGYYNRLDHLVSGREDAFRFFSGPPPIGPLDSGAYANDGVGRICGVEALLRLATERTAALVSITAGNSVRTDRPGGQEELFDYDQLLGVTALASRELPRRWRVGARIRATTGNPYTPVVNRLYDLDTRAYVPVYDAEVDSARLPAFFAADVRFDKDWVYRNWTLTTYLDLQNATNRQNVEVMGWSEDFSEEEPITGLPIVPAFGVRGEW